MITYRCSSCNNYTHGDLFVPLPICTEPHDTGMNDVMFPGSRAEMHQWMRRASSLINAEVPVEKWRRGLLLKGASR